MKRINLRVVGVVAAVTLTSLVAAASASASASAFEAEEYPAIISGNAATSMAITASGISYSCSSPEFSGFFAEGPSGTFEPGATTDGFCESTWSYDADLEMNGCTFIFHADGTADLGPPGCGPMTMTGVTSPECTRTFEPQTGLNVSYQNKGSGSSAYVAAELNATLEYSKVEPEGIYCGKGPGYASVYAVWNLKAHDVEGNPVSLQVDPIAVFVDEGLFGADLYPIGVTGDQVSGDEHALTVKNRTFTCEEITFDSGLTEATSELSIEPVYEGCQAKAILGTFPAQVETNSCGYVLDAGGALDIVCDEEGDKIEFSMYDEEETKLCTYSVGAQSELGSVAYQNVGDDLEVGLELSGVDYIVSGLSKFICGEFGANSNGQYTGASTLSSASS